MSAAALIYLAIMFNSMTTPIGMQLYPPTEVVPREHRSPRYTEDLTITTIRLDLTTLELYDILTMLDASAQRSHHRYTVDISSPILWRLCSSLDETLYTSTGLIRAIRLCKEGHLNESASDPETLHFWDDQ